MTFLFHATVLHVLVLSSPVGGAKQAVWTVKESKCVYACVSMRERERKKENEGEGLADALSVLSVPFLCAGCFENEHL